MSASAPVAWKPTKRQTEAFKILGESFKFYLFYGGSRAGKTSLICRYLILRASKYPGTRHMVGRYRFNSAKRSIWMQTLLPMLRAQLGPEGRAWTENKTDYIVTLANGSELWMAGFDDAERTEKIYSMEFATICTIETQEISYNTFQDLKTRNNAPPDQGIVPKMVLDAQPRGKSHWLYKLFFKKSDPLSKDPIALPGLYVNLKFLPEHNRENLSAGYIEQNLDTLTGVKKKRLRFGDWADLTEGAVYSFDRQVNHVDEPFEYDPDSETWTGWDFGIRADCFIAWFQVVNLPTGWELRFIDEEVDSGKDVYYFGGVVNGKPYVNVEHAGDPAGRARDAKLQSWFSLLAEQGINLHSMTTSFSPADMIDNVNRLMPHIRINETQCPHLVDMFENWSYPVDRSGNVKEGVLPNHDKFSHPGTAVYYALANRFPPRKHRVNITED